MINGANKQLISKKEKNITISRYYGIAITAINVQRGKYVLNYNIFNIFLSKDISDGAIGMTFSPDVSNPHIKRHQNK